MFLQTHILAGTHVYGVLNYVRTYQKAVVNEAGISSFLLPVLDLSWAHTAGSGGSTWQMWP